MQKGKERRIIDQLLSTESNIISRINSTTIRILEIDDEEMQKKELLNLIGGLRYCIDDMERVLYMLMS